MAQIQQTKAGELVIDISSKKNTIVKGANVTDEKVNKGDADITDGFDYDKDNEAKNKPGRETLPIQGRHGDCMMRRCPGTCSSRMMFHRAPNLQ